MKKLIVFVMAIFLGSIMSVFTFADEISIHIMGQELKTEDSPQIIDGRTMVPVRAIFEGIGAEVTWDSNTKTIKGTRENDTVEMVINSDVININGEETTMDASPKIIYGRTYAPARYVAESFGFEVEWDSVNKIVNITSDDIPATYMDFEKEEITETATEATTEAVTEVITQEYEQYSAVYKGNDLYANKDIPAGNYVVIPDENKVAYINIYEYGDTMSYNTGDKKYTYSTGVVYSDVINLKKNQYVSISSGALVPSEIVPQRNISKNGVFRVGIDMPAGHYSFRLDETSCTGYIETKRLSDNSGLSNYKLNNENTEITLKLENGMVVKKYGVDIYDSMLRIYADYYPETTINSTTDSKYNFGDVSEAFKNKIVSELSDEINTYNAGSTSSTRYTKTYVDNKINSWKSFASNQAESKYADIAGSIYNRFYYFTYYSHPELSKFSTVTVYNNIYSGSEYKKNFEYDRNEYLKFAMELSNAQSFDNCETIYYNVYCMYHLVPKGQGWGRN